MERQVIYGVFAIDVELPEKTDVRQEIKDIAYSMKDFNPDEGRFVRAYAKLSDAVADCYDENGWLLNRIMESPDGAINGKSHAYYYPKAIEVNNPI